MVLLWNSLGARHCHALGCEWHLVFGGGGGLFGAGRGLGQEAAIFWGQLGTAGPGKKRAIPRRAGGWARALAVTDTLQPDRERPGDLCAEAWLAQGSDPVGPAHRTGSLLTQLPAAHGLERLGPWEQPFSTGWAQGWGVGSKA